MKWLLVIFGGAVFTAFAWRISQILSADAIGMAIGMTLGVLAGVPAAALILLARRRDDEDSDAGYGPPVTIDQYPPVNPYGYTQAPPPVVIVCKEDFQLIHSRCCDLGCASVRVPASTLSCAISGKNRGCRA